MISTGDGDSPFSLVLLTSTEEAYGEDGARDMSVVTCGSGGDLSVSFFS